ncbi:MULTISPECIES: DNA-3-methyladenine glycosylase family protein [Gordonia]|uniref:3-methyladenine DNA glycosylase / 8-oxoguanine DNA glycosylase n=1 Tax=Gordonia terrae C-6 TaxID=1316928 RepID=R7Y944_9ACTN|nr:MULTISPECIES: 3-methyladenine DNA glycosylase [Gordonia]AFR47306.1 3-methyladenine DNA glycosylase / 8-oxoguanine DNA glycosylase [Gordonia sp. KTR9]EON32523.1 3-methyladenine DNA glycosylase / 8-oxoguanine DNA glycosylase [Gordonia terrae C-6]
MSAVERVREWTPPWPLDIGATVGLHRRGAGDPAFVYGQDRSVWRAAYTPDGPGTLTVRSDGTTVTGRAWGPGADWLLEQMPDFLGASDDPDALVPRHPVVHELVRRTEGLRLGRTDRVWEALVPAILEQKVVGAEAFRAWRYLLRRFGTPAPGPVPETMRVPPPRAEWARIPSWEWHRSGIEPVRMRTIRGATALDVERHAAKLTVLRGVGRWTEAEALSRALGDPDVVNVGDYHIPKLVGLTLIGEAVDDAGMLELLEPYAGQRQRIIRMVTRGGVRPERRGPRMTIRDYRSF